MYKSLPENLKSKKTENQNMCIKWLNIMWICKMDIKLKFQIIQKLGLSPKFIWKQESFHT